MVALVCHNNKSTRYAAPLQSLKHQFQLYLDVEATEIKNPVDFFEPGKRFADMMSDYSAKSKIRSRLRKSNLSSPGIEHRAGPGNLDNTMSGLETLPADDAPAHSPLFFRDLFHHVNLESTLSHHSSSAVRSPARAREAGERPPHRATHGAYATSRWSAHSHRGAWRPQAPAPASASRRIRTIRSSLNKLVFMAPSLRLLGSHPLNKLLVRKSQGRPVPWRNVLG